MWSTSQPAHAVRKSVRYTYGSVPLQLAAGPQKFMPGPTITGTFALRALVCSAGQAVAAACGVRFDCALKFGSLKPSRYFEPAGIVPLTVELLHTIGTNSMPVLPPLRERPQLYHQRTAG